MNRNNMQKLVLSIDTENEDVSHSRKTWIDQCESIKYDAACSMRSRKRSAEVEQIVASDTSRQRTVSMKVQTSLKLLIWK
jgi:hypothetical protein